MMLGTTNSGFRPGQFNQREKAMPVMLILDVSGSMHGEKIERLNAAVREMLEAFADEMRKGEFVYKVAIIKFSTHAEVVHCFKTPVQILSQYQDLQAYGQTWLGEALAKGKALLEDKSVVPSFWYRPAVVLLSDGHPYGEQPLYWKEQLDLFCHEGRSGRKTQRFSIALGDDADEDTLASFAGSQEGVLYAQDAADLSKMFQQVTMTVSQRYRSVNPNDIPSIPKPKLASMHFDDMPASQPHFSSRRKPRVRLDDDNLD
ncbi:vWA domain-containing protein [Mitsuokella jalaludinii]|uniref:vWA domain-containing protein n=1 Tax=Mitsuokella jalaludinii TaxID=187979 RepID=UPI0022E5159B|nr:VWA domain-containing protein [Mitsuokella jalaludinii]